MVSVELVKRYPGFTLDVRWEAEDAVVGLFGPSGAGKTLTLQCLAGLITPDAGRIVVDDRVFLDTAAGPRAVPAPQRRRERRLRAARPAARRARAPRRGGARAPRARRARAAPAARAVGGPAPARGPRARAGDRPRAAAAGRAALRARRAAPARAARPAARAARGVGP